MRFHTEYLTFSTKERREYINITREVERALQKSGAKTLGITGRGRITATPTSRTC